MSTNAVVRRLHFWISIAVAIPALVVVGSGLLLQTKKHWSWVQPPEMHGTGSLPLVTLDALLSSLVAAPGLGVDGWDDVNRIDVRPAKGVAKVWLHSGWETQVDLGTGRVLQHAYRRSDLIEAIHDGSYLGGNWTKLGVFLPSGLLLFFMWASGVWLLVSTLLAKRRRTAALARSLAPGSR